MAGVAGGAAAVVLPGRALAQAARCADVAPGPRPQNTPRSFVGQTLDEIVERGFAEFALYENLPPYSWLEAGRPRGVDVAVARIVAEALGVEARIRLVQASETVEADLMNYVWRGSVVGGRVSNVMLRVPYDSAFACRIEHVVFTGQYSVETLAVAYRRADYPDEGPGPGSFRTASVAVENDSLADFYLSGIGRGLLMPNIRRFRTTAQAVAALAEGEVRTAMGARGQLEWGVRDRPDLAVHVPHMPGLARGTWTLGLAVHQSHRDLAYAADDAIRAALEDGRIAAAHTALGLSFTPPDR